MRRFAILYIIIFILAGSKTMYASDIEQDNAAVARQDSLYADAGALLDAVIDYNEERYEEAISKLKVLAEKHPKDDAVSYYLGLSKFSLKQSDAEPYLEAALAADSTNIWYMHALLTYYSSVSKKAEFAQIGQRLVDLSPTHSSNPYTLYLLGDAMYATRRDSLALKYFEKALEYEPNYPPAQFGRMEVLMAQGNMPQFFLEFENFIKNDLVRSEIKLSYLENIMDAMDARFYWLYGKSVMNLVDLCCELYPQSAKAQLLKVRSFLIKGESEAALEQTQVLAEVASAAGDNQSLAQAYNIMGDIYHNEGNTRACFRAYDKALKADPDCLPVLNNYAYYLSQRKRQLRKALAMSARTIELSPDNATYLDTYGWILFLLRRPAEAKPHFKRAMLYGGKDSAVVLEHFAQVLRALKEYDLAIYYDNLAKQKASK